MSERASRPPSVLLKDYTVAGVVVLSLKLTFIAYPVLLFTPPVDINDDTLVVPLSLLLLFLFSTPCFSGYMVNF